MSRPDIARDSDYQALSKAENRHLLNVALVGFGLVFTGLATMQLVRYFGHEEVVGPLRAAFAGLIFTSVTSLWEEHSYKSPMVFAGVVFMEIGLLACLVQLLDRHL